MTENEAKNGEVIWYNERKGYGFVKIDSAEVFLHRSTLDRFGLIRLLTGDQVSGSTNSVRAMATFNTSLSTLQKIPIPKRAATPISSFAMRD